MGTSAAQEERGIGCDPSQLPNSTDFQKWWAGEEEGALTLWCQPSAASNVPASSSHSSNAPAINSTELLFRIGLKDRLGAGCASVTLLCYVKAFSYAQQYYPWPRHRNENQKDASAWEQLLISKCHFYFLTYPPLQTQTNTGP